MKIEIKNIFGDVIFETEAADLKSGVIAGVKANADLRSADLSSADLSSADLSSANLRSADLSYADLDKNTILSWSSHDLIAHLLFSSAKEDASKRMLAGLILISKDWCWEQFFKIETPERAWAIEVLKAQNPEGMPEMLKEAPLPAPKESRELLELREAWAWALPSVKIHVRYWAARTDSPFWVGQMREESKRCRRLLEIVEK
jgi:hypothetical protein